MLFHCFLKKKIKYVRGGLCVNRTITDAEQKKKKRWSNGRMTALSFKFRNGLTAWLKSRLIGRPGALKYPPKKFFFGNAWLHQRI